MWNKINNINTKDKIKCKEKKNFKVNIPTVKPPHNQIIKKFPKIGITETNFVITVAAQNDIWPQGKVYPKNAIIINKIKIEIPEIHVSIIL